MPATFLGELATHADIISVNSSIVVLGDGAPSDSLVAVAVNSSSLSDTAMSCVDSKGNTWVAGGHNRSVLSGRARLFYSRLTTPLVALDTITVTGNSARRAIIVSAFSGPGTNVAVDQVPGEGLSDEGFNDAIVVESNTPPIWSTIAVAAAGYQSTATSITPTNGTSLSTTARVATNNGFAVSLMYKLNTPAGQYVDLRADLSPGADWVALSHSIKAASSGSSSSQKSSNTNFLTTRTRLKVF